MARYKRGAKTQAVRDFIAANPKANPKAIVAGVKAEKGIAIKIGLANSIKYGRRTPKGRKGRAPTLRVAARRTTAAVISVEQLIEVKRLADAMGGAEQVRRALEALQQLQ